MALDSTVKVKFLGDAAQLAREAAKASRSTEQVGKSAQTATGHLSKMAKGLVAGAGIAAAGVAIERFAKSSVNAYKAAAGEASKLNRLTGLAVEDASRLGFAAQQSGLDSDTFAKALGLLSKNLNAADKEQTKLVKTSHLAVVQVPKLVKGHIEYVSQLKRVTDTQKKTVPGLQSLGFAIRDASGHLLPMNRLLPQIADKFAKMPNGPEKTALALKLFGRGGAALLPFLNKGAEGIAKLNDEADRLGVTMTGKDLVAYKAYIVAQREFRAAMQGIKITLGRELFPLFTAWSMKVAENAPQINEFARSFVQKLGPALQGAADNVKALHDKLAPMVQFVVDHQQAFTVLAAGIVGLKVAASVAGSLTVLRTALFGVAAGEAAVAGAAVPAAAAMSGFAAVGAAGAAGITGIGAAAAATIGPVAALTAGVLLAVAAFERLAIKRDAFNVDSPDFASNDPNLAPFTPDRGGMLFGGVGFSPDSSRGRSATGGASSGAGASGHDMNVGGVKPRTPFQRARDEATKQADATKNAAGKAKAEMDKALAAQLAQAAAAQKAADAKQVAADALQKASDAMRDALQSRLDTAKGIRDNLVSSNSIVREGLSWTAKDLLARFRTTMEKVKRFQTAVQSLVRKGFDQSIVQQVAAGGVANLGTATGLAHASAAQVSQANSIQRQIEKSAGLSGNAVASQMGPIQITSILKVSDRELARAVNTWNAENRPNGHRLAS